MQIIHPNSPVGRIGHWLGDQEWISPKSPVAQTSDAIHNYTFGQIGLPAEAFKKRRSHDLRGSITPGSPIPAAAVPYGEAGYQADRDRWRQEVLSNRGTKRISGPIGGPGGVGGGPDMSVDGMTAWKVARDKAMAMEPGAEQNAAFKEVDALGMAIWADQHKGMAAKVKPGQAGYDVINPVAADTRAYAEDIGRSIGDTEAILGNGLETVFTPDGRVTSTPVTQSPTAVDLPLWRGEETVGNNTPFFASLENPSRFYNVEDISDPSYFFNPAIVDRLLTDGHLSRNYFAGFQR